MIRIRVRVRRHVAQIRIKGRVKPGQDPRYVTGGHAMPPFGIWLESVPGPA